MTTSKHTQGPWDNWLSGSNVGITGPEADQLLGGQFGVGGNYARTTPVFNIYGVAVALAYGKSQSIADANASRIVACVNACEGINPEAVKDLLIALKHVRFICSEPTPGSTLTWEELASRIVSAIEPVIAKAKGE